MLIPEVNEQSSGNFSCTASNSIGEDTVVYAVVSVAPPAAPLLSLQYTTASTVRLHWRLPADNPHPVLGNSPFFQIISIFPKPMMSTWIFKNVDVMNFLEMLYIYL